MLRGVVRVYRLGGMVHVYRLGRLVGVQRLWRIVSIQRLRGIVVVQRLWRVVGVYRLRGMVDILRRIVATVLRLVVVVVDRVVVVVGGVGRGRTVDWREESGNVQFDEDDISPQDLLRSLTSYWRGWPSLACICTNSFSSSGGPGSFPPGESPGLQHQYPPQPHPPGCCRYSAPWSVD